MRHDTSRKGESILLRGGIDSSQQAATCESAPARIPVYRNLAQVR
jgi:hypothetical protein